MGGHIIIKHDIRNALSDSMNNAALPDPLRGDVNAVLAKDDSAWTQTDCIVLAGAVGYLLCNCP